MKKSSGHRDEKISIIIPTHNSRDVIGRCLASLPGFDDEYQWETIVVDSSNDGTPEYVKRMFPYVQLHSVTYGSHCGHNRNVGVEVATGDILAFLDSDTVVSPKWLDAILDYRRRGFHVIAGYTEYKYQRVPMWIDGQDITWPTCNIAYTRELMDDVGRFREDMLRGSDCDYNYRIVKKGYIIGFNPHMWVTHKHRTTLRGFFDQSIGNGRARYTLKKNHKDLRFGISPLGIVRKGLGAYGYVTARFKRK